MRDAFHQAAIARDHPGFVVDDLLAEARAKRFLGDGHTDRRGDALTKRAGCGLDPSGMAIFRVASSGRAQLAEILDLLDAHAGISRQVQQTVEQHGPVPGREHEPVAIRPVRSRGVKAQIFVEQNGCHIRHAHRHAGMAGIGRLHRVQRQHTQRVCHLEPARIRRLHCRDAHVYSPSQRLIPRNSPERARTMSIVTLLVKPMACAICALHPYRGSFLPT